VKVIRAVALAFLAGCAATGGTVTSTVRYEAILTRDRYGVPHVAGRTPADAAYALGQAQAEDRPADIVHNLSVGIGRLAELFGPAWLESDRGARELGHRARAEADWPRLPLAVQQMVEGFVAGVNDWIAEHPKTFPGPVRGFDAVDVVAWHRHLLMAPELALARLDAEGGPGPRVEAGGSNAWAVAGARSATGKPVLLIDAHAPFEGARAPYEAHLRAGELDVWGYFPVGSPLPLAGATPWAAWALTTGGADSSDAYALRINPADPDEYEWEGRFVRMELRREAIRVREPGRLKDVEEKFRRTRHGPVLLDSRGRAFAAWLGSADHARALEQFWRMSTARGGAEFKAALALDRISGVGVVWASTDGAIGFVQTGQVPERAGGQDWEKPVPGWSPLTFPAGKVPFYKLPRVDNPPAGFLQSCDVSDDRVTPGLAWRREDFPAGALYAHFGEYRARAQRATDLLKDTPRMDLDAARRLAFDTYSPPADLWIPVLLAAAKEAGFPEELAEAVDLLRGWSRHADAGSAGATLFRFWRFACADVPGGRAGRDTFSISDTPEIRRESLDALRRAVETLRRLHGRVAVPWGEVNRLRRGSAEWGLSGDGLSRLGLDTLRATGGPALEGGKIVCRSGQSSPAIVFLGEVPVIHAVTAYGQSHDPESPHYADQAPLFARHELRHAPWTAGEIVSRTTVERTVSGPR
jgi:acyl-homoserine-lactone acylase